MKNNTFKIVPTRQLVTFLLIFSLLQTLSFDVRAEGAIGFQAAEGEKHAKPKKTGGLTDQEYITSKTYVHEGKTKRMIDEACKGMEKECAGGETDWKFLGLNPKLIKALAKAYAMILPAMNMMGGSDKPEMEQVKGKDGKMTMKPKKKPGMDYCAFLPMASEAIATFNQSAEQKTIMSVPDTKGSEQKSQLYKAARSHKARANSAKIQFYGWSATAACYLLVRMAWQGAWDWKSALKLAAAALLAWFYYKESQAHMDAYRKIKAIADRLPGPGHCNPITETHCYCAQPETQYDPKYCLPKMHKKAISKNAMRVSCVDDKLKADPSCSCIAKDTCFDKKYMNMIKGSAAGPAFAESSGGLAKGISRGQLKGASASGGSSKRWAGLLRKLKKNAKPFDGNLTKSQREEAKMIHDASGIPLAMAKRLASQPYTSSMDKHMGRFAGSSGWNKKNVPTYKPRRKSRVLTFRGGGGRRKSRRKSSFSSFNFKRKKKRGGGGKNILKFADHAQREAQINKDKGKNLFEIISRRYQISGRRRLEIK